MTTGIYTITNIGDKVFPKILEDKDKDKDTKKKLNMRRQNTFKKVSIDNIVFESIKDASKQLNISYHKVKYRLKSKNYPTYIYIEESGK